MEDSIEVVYNKSGKLLLVIGESAIEVTRLEAEALFVDLGHALKNQDEIQALDKEN